MSPFSSVGVSQSCRVYLTYHIVKINIGGGGYCCQQCVVEKFPQSLWDSPNDFILLDIFFDIVKKFMCHN